MPTTTITSREYNRNRSLADKAIQKGPVVITRRGRPAKVILSFDEYERLSGKKKNIVELLAMPGVDLDDFEPPRLGGEFPVPADLS